MKVCFCKTEAYYSDYQEISFSHKMFFLSTYSYFLFFCPPNFKATGFFFVFYPLVSLEFCTGPVNVELLK